MKRQEIIDTVNAIMGEKGDYAAEYIRAGRCRRRAGGKLHAVHRSAGED